MIPSSAKKIGYFNGKLSLWRIIRVTDFYEIPYVTNLRIFIAEVFFISIFELLAINLNKILDKTLQLVQVTEVEVATVQL